MLQVFIAVVVILSVLVIAKEFLRRQTVTEAARIGFQFSVEEAFYIKPPVDRVILVGLVDEGTVRPGDALVVMAMSGPIDVVVDRIEVFRQSEGAASATKGQQVGLRLVGINQQQVASSNLKRGSLVRSPSTARPELRSGKEDRAL